MPLLLLAACALGCTAPAERPTDPAPPGPDAPSERRASASGVTARPWEPLPPEGVLLPAVGTARHVVAGDRAASFVWKAVCEVDPADPPVVRTLAGLRQHRRVADAGDAGAELYRAQVEAAGAPITGGMGSGFSYLLRDRSLVVIVEADVEGGSLPDAFAIVVGRPGG